MKFLSDEWIARQADGSAAATDGAFTGSVLTIVTGGPDGEIRYVTTFEDGRGVSVVLGGVGGWSVSLTLNHGDARAVHDGRPTCTRCSSPAE